MLLVTGRSVLTGRLDHPEIANGGVVVDGASIIDVGDRAALRRTYPDASEIGGPDFIVMPGLVSAHQHGGGVSSVQLGCLDRPFEAWLLAMFGLIPLDIRLDTTFHALRLLENGVTTTLHSHYTRDPDRYDDEVAAILAGYADAGMRVGFAPCFMDRNLLTYGDDEAFLAALPADLATAARGIKGAGIAADAYVAFVTELARRSSGDTRTILFGPVAPQWCSTGMLEEIGAAVQAGVAGVHTHLLETSAQRAYLDRSLGRSVVTALDDWGLLGRAASVAHGVYLRPGEIEHLAATGTTVVANPGCNLRLGNGRVPIGAFLGAGVHVAVGTDDMTIGDDDDLLGELRLLRSLARPDGAWADASLWMHAATGAGARAVGLDHVIGSLEVGKQADMVLVDARRITEPFTDADVSDLELVLARGRGADVATVLVAGEVVIKDRRHRSIDRLALTSAVRDVAVAQHRDPVRRALAGAMASLADARANWPDVSAGPG